MMPQHLLIATKLLRDAGYAVIPQSRIKDVSSEHHVSHYDLKSYKDPAKFLDGLARERVKVIAEFMRTSEAIAETVGENPDSRFKVYRSSVRVIKPGMAD